MLDNRSRQLLKTLIERYIAEGQPVGSRALARTLVVPVVRVDGAYLAMLIGMVGTTIAPWMQFYLQSAVVEKNLHLCALFRTIAWAGGREGMPVSEGRPTGVGPAEICGC